MSKPWTTPKLSEKSRNDRRSNRLLVLSSVKSALIYTVTVFIRGSLRIGYQENYIFCQKPYIYQKSSQCNLTVQIEPMHDKEKYLMNQISHSTNSTKEFIFQRPEVNWNQYAILYSASFQTGEVISFTIKKKRQKTKSQVFLQTAHQLLIVNLYLNTFLIFGGYVTLMETPVFFCKELILVQIGTRSFFVSSSTWDSMFL